VQWVYSLAVQSLSFLWEYLLVHYLQVSFLEGLIQAAQSMLGVDQKLRSSLLRSSTT
jgi:hypothetical protein